MNEDHFTLLVAKVLSNEASAAELTEFHHIVLAKPEFKSLYHNLEEIWKSSYDTPENIHSGEEAYLIHLGRLKSQVTDFREDIALVPVPNEDFQLYPVKRAWFKKRRLFAMATVLLVLSAFLFPLFIHHRSGSLADTPKRINEIKVQPGVKTKLQLPDKSQVWVNSDSKLSYPDNFNGATREVFLDGEAYFDVIKDSDHPFIVHTAGLDIKVLGTAFNVKAYRSESQIEATLIHGMIEVTRTNQPNAPRMILKPHEKMVFDKYAVEEIPVTDARITDNKAVQPAITILPLLKNRADSALSETSWVYNRLSFEDEKFGDLALKMERWFNVVINMSNEKLRAFRLTGSFEKETIEEALRELQYLVSFQYRISGNEISIEKK